jgi:putative Ca2+/H+ antiporter (TMEM165/GDT1 family)
MWFAASPQNCPAKCFCGIENSALAMPGIGAVMGAATFAVIYTAHFTYSAFLAYAYPQYLPVQDHKKRIFR